MMKNKPESLVWKTEKRNVNALVAFPGNPRQVSEKQRTDLEESLVKFNLVEIPAINLDNTALAGHQRLKILVALGRGEEEIDVRVPNRMLTAAEVKEYNIRSNKNTGEWDIDMLKDNFDLTDLLSWGFEQSELQEMGLEIPQFTPTAGEDQPRLDVKNPVTCPGCGLEFTP
jgi:hypothetical protein